MNPIFENIIRGFAPHLPPARLGAEDTCYMDALEPRTCACGEPTGSVALDTCEECEGHERASSEAGLALEDVSEYDSAAEWCARRGIAGSTGDPLPDGLSASVADAINADADAFRERVRETAYGLALEDTCRRSIRDASVDHARSVADLYDDGGAR